MLCAFSQWSVVFFRLRFVCCDPFSDRIASYVPHSHSGIDAHLPWSCIPNIIRSFLMWWAFVWTGVTALRIPFFCVSRLVRSVFFFSAVKPTKKKFVSPFRRFGKLGYFIFAFFAWFQVMMKLFFPSGRFLMRFFTFDLLLLRHSLNSIVLVQLSLHRLIWIFVLGFPPYYVCCFCLSWCAFFLLSQFQVVLILLFKLSFFLHFFLRRRRSLAKFSCFFVWIFFSRAALLSFFSLSLSPVHFIAFDAVFYFNNM